MAMTPAQRRARVANLLAVQRDLTERRDALQDASTSPPTLAEARAANVALRAEIAALGGSLSVGCRQQDEGRRETAGVP